MAYKYQQLNQNLRPHSLSTDFRRHRTDPKVFCCLFFTTTSQEEIVTFQEAAMVLVWVFCKHFFITC